MKQIFKNYTAVKPVRSVLNEWPPPRSYGLKEKLFSRDIEYTRKHAYIDDLEKENEENDNTIPYYLEPVRSVVDEETSSPSYGCEEKLFSRGVEYTRKHAYIDDLENEKKSSLIAKIKKRVLIKKKNK